MTLRFSIIVGAAALTLTACGQAAEDPVEPASTEEAVVGLTDSELRQAKTQCEIAAVAQGGTAEQAKALCECTIEKVAEGKSLEEFAAVSEEDANAALDQCAAETGIAEAL